MFFKQKKRKQIDLEIERQHQQKLQITKEVCHELNDFYMLHYGERPFNIGMSIEEFVIRSTQVLIREIKSSKDPQTLMDQDESDNIQI